MFLLQTQAALNTGQGERKGDSSCCFILHRDRISGAEADRLTGTLYTVSKRAPPICDGTVHT